MGYKSCDTTKLSEAVLKELHKDHPGIVQMKSIARSYIFGGRE